MGNDTWNLGDLRPGQVRKIVVHGAVSGTAMHRDLLSNRVTVVSDNTDTNRVEEPTLVITNPPAGGTEIRITKRDDIDPIQPGSNLTYTIGIGDDERMAYRRSGARSVYADCGGGNRFHGRAGRKFPRE